ncbi:MAG: sulfite exporter TauE/SafE family protein [Deltaproteobacteria bacterium]|nr:sulfite exporter TauE/SafE family protein [Deltaproteobacteria bacterium]
MGFEVGVESLVLWGVSALTAAVSAVLGLAGGIMLLAVMLLFLEPAVAIPVHAVAQLASNASRSLVHRRAVRRDLLLPYLILLLPAGMLSVPLTQRADPDLLRLAIGIFVLIATWRREWLLFGFDPGRIPTFPRFTLVGGLAGFFGPVVGATGPFIAPFFLGLGLSRFELIGTTAACQATGHLVKLALFGSGGFDFAAHAVLYGGMIAAVVIGTSLGTKLLHRIPEKHFPAIYKTALSLVAARLVGSGALALVGD